MPKSFLFSICVMWICLFPPPAIAQGKDLGAALTNEGQLRRAAHQFLFNDYITDRRTAFKGKGHARMLDEVVVSDERISVRDGETISLPAGTQQVASMFRHFGFRGKNFDRLENIEVLPFAANSHPHGSKHEDQLFRVQMVALPIPTPTMPAIEIRFEIEGGHEITIDEFFLSSQGKLSTKFDDIPYRNLGYDRPRKSVPLDIDFRRELSVGGHVELEREKWFRYYAIPGGVHPSFETWARERNFSPGRQIFKMEPGLVKGYSPRQPLLKEVEAGSGVPDLSFFEKYDSSPQATNAIPAFRNIDFAMCFDEWPAFMSRKPNGRGTPKREHFDHAAQLVQAYVADQIKDGGRTATWWEVKNESSIKSEWDFHYNEGVDAWELLSDFHNRVAKSIHEVSPETKVGGPSSAWMQVQSANFGLFRNQAKFIDQTRGHIDFFSHHFYEDIGSLGAFERRGDNYHNYLLGMLEAVLDMLRAHMHHADHVRPILITECGSLQEGRSPVDHWLRLRSYSAYLTKMMQRPDELDLVVPFIFLQKPWAPHSGNVAFTPKEGFRVNGAMEGFNDSILSRFFDLWSDFNGRRLNVSFDQRWLDVVAVHRGNRIQLAVTNMGGNRVGVDLSEVLDQLRRDQVTCTDVTQKRLRYFDGEVLFEDSATVKNPSEIPVDVEETTVITLNLSQQIQPKRTVIQERFYAGATAVKAAQHETTFPIKVNQPSEFESVELVVGVYRSGGFPKPLKVTMNGTTQTIPMQWADEFKQVFLPVMIPVAAGVVKDLNEVKIGPADGLTVTSVHLRTLREIKP